MKPIVAFCGSKGSGKSTSATIFREVTKCEVEEIAIAGLLKTACAETFTVPMEKFLDPTLKEVELENAIVLDRNNITTVLRAFNVSVTPELTVQLRNHWGRVIWTPRKLLQYIGTEVLHPIDPLIHAKAALLKKDQNKITLITDLRFVSEFDYLKSTFGSTFVPVYVKNSKAEIAASTDSHPSERQFVEFKDRCTLLENDGSLSELRERIAEFAGSLGE